MEKSPTLCCSVCPGAQFSRHAEVLFYPGNQRLSIVQTGRGLDDHNHLTVDTVLSGSVPFLPPGAEVAMDPFKETYQYYPSGEHSVFKSSGTAVLAVPKMRCRPSASVVLFSQMT